MSGPAPLHTAVREPRIAGSGAPPLLVMLHGYGSDEADLLGLADFLDPRLRVLSVRAPMALDMGGYAWFPLEITGVGLAADYEEAERSLARLAGHLDAVLAEQGHGAGETLLLGFSQGGAMALELLLERPEAVTGVAFLSGLWSKQRLPPDPARRAAVKGKPVLQTHGRSADPPRRSAGDAGPAPGTRGRPHLARVRHGPPDRLDRSAPGGLRFRRLAPALSSLRRPPSRRPRRARSGPWRRASAGDR